MQTIILREQENEIGNNYFAMERLVLQKMIEHALLILNMVPR